VNILDARFVAVAFAAWCINCDRVIFDVRAGACPICTSKQFVPVTTWLQERKEA
jgi:RNA polymerase subunit RPABC4/transcription elongation factor Spt4